MENGKPPVRFKDYGFNIQVCTFYLFFCYGCDYFLKLWDIVELILWWQMDILFSRCQCNLCFYKWFGLFFFLFVSSIHSSHHFHISTSDGNKCDDKPKYFKGSSLMPSTTLVTFLHSTKKKLQTFFYCYFSTTFFFWCFSRVL